MPTYEYACKSCEKIHEVEQKITDEKLKVCPSEGCSGEVKRLISSSATKGFVCKGDGWYRDGYT
jgi:putative FmdB family regulatory protein